MVPEKERERERERGKQENRCEIIEYLSVGGVKTGKAGLEGLETETFEGIGLPLSQLWFTEPEEITDLRTSVLILEMGLCIPR
jgi:hypothetical protein